ncbi:homocysteine S-methyltransferase family protein [Microbacterium pygmaeum]|uniref:homocysteine S-methyltransferase family protein n=1 Tax=Microbacterium pygmaeum TaxID=370764 RepID=UPI0012F7290C|nr:homocysteine S-methyltransferase family protein [Microbacterium pygmaeum]
MSDTAVTDRVEAIPSLAELEAVCRELDGLGARAWISVTVAGGALRTGESLRDAFAIAASVPEVLAVGVDCCAVSEITDIAGRLAATRGASPAPSLD